MNISAVVIAKNEERTIERCLKSISFVDDIVVVDGFSTDNTAALAARCGARVIQHQWAGYGAQKNRGMAETRNEWVLFLDADEEIPAALAKEISAAVASPQFDIYWLRVLDIFLGAPLRHTTGNNPRLFRKSKAHWNGRLVHEQVALRETGAPVQLYDTHSGVLPTPLIHHSYTSIGAYLAKMHRYTTLDAKQMAETGIHRSGKPVVPAFFLPYALAARQAVKLLFWKKGILDGYAGMMWGILSAYYEWEMGHKYLALTRVRKSNPL